MNKFQVLSPVYRQKKNTQQIIMRAFSSTHDICYGAFRLESNQINYAIHSKFSEVKKVQIAPFKKTVAHMNFYKVFPY